MRVCKCVTKCKQNVTHEPQIYTFNERNETF